jgi:hypothetical protein
VVPEDDLVDMKARQYITDLRQHVSQALLEFPGFTGDLS